jgi:hypothetical protein
LEKEVSLLRARNTLVWDEFATFTDISQRITLGNVIDEDFKDKYRLNTADGKFDLFIKSPILRDGGRYRCSMRTDAIEYSDAEVIVSGKPYFIF